MRTIIFAIRLPAFLPGALIRGRCGEGRSGGKSFYNLSQKVGPNFNTIKKNCNFLKLLGLIEIDRTPAEESASGKGHYEVKITKEGKDFLDSIRD